MGPKLGKNPVRPLADVLALCRVKKSVKRRCSRASTLDGMPFGCAMVRFRWRQKKGRMWVTHRFSSFDCLFLFSPSSPVLFLARRSERLPSFSTEFPRVWPGQSRFKRDRTACCHCSHRVVSHWRMDWGVFSRDRVFFLGRRLLMARYCGCHGFQFWATFEFLRPNGWIFQRGYHPLKMAPAPSKDRETRGWLSIVEIEMMVLRKLGKSTAPVLLGSSVCVCERGIRIWRNEPTDGAIKKNAKNSTPTPRRWKTFPRSRSVIDFNDENTFSFRPRSVRTYFVLLFFRAYVRKTSKRESRLKAVEFFFDILVIFWSFIGKCIYLSWNVPVFISASCITLVLPSFCPSRLFVPIFNRVFFSFCIAIRWVLPSFFVQLM